MMKRTSLVLVVFVLLTVKLTAQSPTPTPSAQTNSVRTQMANAAEVNDSFDRMRQLEIQTTSENPGNPLVGIEELFYRKPGKKETKILNPSKHLLEKYAVFLSQPDTGIVKLNSDSDCVKNSNVLVVKENCLQYPFPGAGTAFSFRTKSYRIPHLADLILSKNILKTDGILQQGIIVFLPNTLIENVTLQTKGMKYLVDFQPAENVEQLKKHDAALIAGLKADGFAYGMGFYVKDQKTFALRSIAYKGKIMRSYKGTSFNELNFDKRGDIIVAFQIVELDTDGNITIVWKKLSQTDAPEMKIDINK